MPTSIPGEEGGGREKEEKMMGWEEQKRRIYISTKHKPDTHTHQTYTPQPSTPIKHAGSDIWDWEEGI